MHTAPTVWLVISFNLISLLHLIIHVINLIKLYINLSLIYRLIFEEIPLTIEGVCVATNVAGVERKYFKIKLLSLDRTNEILENSVNEEQLDEHSDLTSDEIDEIRVLRHDFVTREKKRIREQQKV